MAYSDAETTEAMIRLAVNKYNYKLTAEQTGIDEKTLRRWDKIATKKTVPELLERAIERLLMVIPADMKGSDWAVSFGILMDKWLLMNGQATSRTENLIGNIDNLPEKEKDAVIREAERIIAEAVGKRTGGGNDTDSNQ